MFRLKDTLFSQRIFKSFDGDDNGTIAFDEFVIGLSAMTNRASVEEKLKCKSILVPLIIQQSHLRYMTRMVMVVLTVRSYLACCRVWMMMMTTTEYDVQHH